MFEKKASSGCENSMDKRLIDNVQDIVDSKTPKLRCRDKNRLVHRS